MLLIDLVKDNLINPPEWLPQGTQFLAVTGSHSYGASDNDSDYDVYGWTIPNKTIVFPHLAGKVLNFDKNLNDFMVWQQHHVEYKSKIYDFQIYNIVHYFRRLADNNPNILDSTFVPDNCVLYCTKIGNMVRENRRMFLHKGSFHRFKGFAYSQLNKLKIKNPTTGKRKEYIEKYKFDVKFSYHVVRLMLEAQQILEEGDLDLERHSATYRAIRNGEWTEEEITTFFSQKEKELEDICEKSSLPWGPNEDKIRELLLACLEEYYGCNYLSISKMITL